MAARTARSKSFRSSVCPATSAAALIAEAGERGAGSATPGTVVDVERGLVACGMGTVLEIREVLPAGKRAMAWGDFVRGRRVEAGTVLGAPGGREG